MQIYLLLVIYINVMEVDISMKKTINKTMIRIPIYFNSMFMLTF